jgi:hypothetical protein
MKQDLEAWSIDSILVIQTKMTKEGAHSGHGHYNYETNAWDYDLSEWASVHDAAEEQLSIQI